MPFFLTWGLVVADPELVHRVVPAESLEQYDEMYGEDGPFNVQLAGASTWLGWGNGGQVTLDFADLVKEIARLDGDIESFVSPAIAAWVRQKVKKTV